MSTPKNKRAVVTKNTKRQNQRRSTTDTEEKPSLLKITQMIGVKKLLLSPLTQLIVNCRVGEDITAEKPWIYVPKDKILDNIELHENSSEFLPVKDYIIAYPNDQILIGCYGHQQEMPEEFMVCTTLEATQCAIDVLETQKAQMQNKVTKICGKWSSMGSEFELNDTICESLRSFFKIHLTLDHPHFSYTKRFTIRLAADAPDGYVELVTTRQIYQNIYRQRVDANNQSLAQKIDAASQTKSKKPISKQTQYQYTYTPIKMTDKMINNILSYLRHRNDHILDLLQTNYYMDLCIDEYNFPNAKKMEIFELPVCILSFQDLFMCRGMKVSSISWNAMISGLIAVSYVKQPYSNIVSEEFKFSPIQTIYRKHLVLLWSYTDTLKPILYFHSDREVTTISFCPYNADILVGGCENGQIVVWDITGKLKQSELKNVKSSPLDYRAILETFMDWMKKPAKANHVFPILTSIIELSHSDPVSDIRWISPSQHITKNGKIKMTEKGDAHMQFVSCSTGDNCVLVWDLKIEIETKSAVSTRKRCMRLSKLPKSLTKHESPLKSLKNIFSPKFKLILLEPDTRKNIIIKKILRQNDEYTYEALNPETEDQILKRTLYKQLPLRDKSLRKQNFIFTTSFGEVRNCHWDGFDYNMGQKVNSDICTVFNYKVIHDGPIIVCVENPTLKHIFMTLGGSVFALWNRDNIQRPLIWRKSTNRYISGSWIQYHPCSFGLVRNDTNIEIWNLQDDSKNALKMIKLKGNPTMGFLNDYSKEHVQKGTFALTDSIGAIQIFSLNKKTEKLPNELNSEINQYIINIEARRRMLSKLTETLKKKFKPETSDEVNEVELQQNQPDKIALVNDNGRHAEIKKIKTITEADKWEMNQQQYMIRTLFASKDIALDQLNEQRKMLIELEENKKKKLKKIHELIKNKENVMNDWRIHLMPDEKQHKIRKKISVNFPKEIVDYMKETHMEHYKEMENHIMKYINSHKYNRHFCWSEMLKNANDRFNGLIQT